MDENKILFPYNFTEMDHRAMKFILQTYGTHEDARVTLFHAYAPVPEIILSRNSVMEKMSANLHYLRQQVAEQEGRLIAVKQRLLEGGFKTSQVNHLYLPKKRALAEEIILLARDQGYKTIVLSRSGTAVGFFKTSVSTRVAATLKNAFITIIT